METSEAPRGVAFIDTGYLLVHISVGAPLPAAAGGSCHSEPATQRTIILTIMIVQYITSRVLAVRLTDYTLCFV